MGRRGSILRGRAEWTNQGVKEDIFGEWALLFNYLLTPVGLCLINFLKGWGCSSDGRALEWHSRGRRFDPAQLHQISLELPTPRLPYISVLSI